MIVSDVRIKSSAASISILWRLSGREAAAIRPSASPVVKEKLDAEALTPGLSIGVLFGALVIMLSWILTWIYVRWANTHYDKALDEMRSGSPK